MGIDAEQLRRDATERIESVKTVVGETLDTVKVNVTDAVTQLRTSTVAADAMEAGAKSASHFASENPLGVLAGAAIAGMLIGAVVPVTQIERARIGPIRDDLYAKGKKAAKDALDTRVRSIRTALAGIVEASKA